MRTVKDRSLIVLAAACLAVGAAACGSSGPNKPPADSTIVFGSHQPQTGPAAPGYSEISTASQAFFSYVNAHGGVYGRPIKMIVFNDAYNPTETVAAMDQLVLYDNVFGIFEGLGTPTHAQVEPFLNAYQVPDLFVASGCPCFQDGSTDPWTYGWPPSTMIEGKILGSYIRRHFPGARVGVLYQDDPAGKAALTGLRNEVPKVVARQAYRAGTTTVTPQLRALKAARTSVLVDFTLPTYTALGQLTSLKLGYSPHLVVWSAGSDPVTVARLINVYSDGAFHGYGLIEGAITDSYLPPPTDLSNRWIRLFKGIQHQYDPSVGFDTNVEYGMASAYTLVQALRAAGPNLTRQGLINAINAKGSRWRGPGLVPMHYSESDHGGFTGVQIGEIESGQLHLLGTPLVTTSKGSAPIVAYHGVQPAPPANGFPGATP